MAKTAVPAFVQTAKTWYATATTAFSLTGAGSILDDNPSNTVLLVTAGSEGCTVNSIKIMPRATVTATKAAVFLSKDGGTTKKFLFDVVVAAHTMATTTSCPQYTIAGITEATPYRMEAADRLYIGLGATQSNGVNFEAETTDY